MGVLKIKIKFKLFKLFLICMLVQTIFCSDNANYLKCTKAKELDADCGRYCYQIVKPLLQHATVVHDKEKEFTKLRDTIHDQEIIIKNFEVQQVQIDLLSSYKAQLAAKDALIEALQEKINEKQSEAKIKELEAKQSNASLSDSNWIVIQRRKDDNVDFNRNWNEYRRGFGDSQGSFFLGLDKLHLLTNEQPHELYIYLKNFEDENHFAFYDNFRIGDENESFKIKSIGKYYGNAGDAFSSHLNMVFSTPDREVTAHKSHCAFTYKSGWWFRKRCNSNLNGRYDGNVHQWSVFFKNPLTYVEMMIRPKVIKN